MSETKNELEYPRWMQITKTAIWSLCVLSLGVLAYLSFFLSSTKFELNKQFTAFCTLFVFCCLAALFDEASFGGVIKLQRKVKKIEKEKEEKEKKADLLQERLFQHISNSVSNFNAAIQSNQIRNSQTTNNFLSNQATVSPEPEDNEEEEEAPVTVSASNMTTSETKTKRIFELIDRFAEINKLEKYNLQRWVTINSDGKNIDGICSKKPKIHGYYKKDNAELFIYVPGVTKNPSVRLNQIYRIVSLVDKYFEMRPEAQLVLIVSDSETSEELTKSFKPAIEKGLLKIVVFETPSVPQKSLQE